MILPLESGSYSFYLIGYVVESGKSGGNYACKKKEEKKILSPRKAEKAKIDSDRKRGYNNNN